MSDSTIDVSRLRPHPRLVLTDDRLDELRRAVRTDAFSKAMVAGLKARAAVYLRAAEPARELEGRRLLAVSRRVFGHVSVFALLARLTGEAAYVQAARREMLAAASFADWNPSHFLDTAEMCAALSLGYDWLFDELTVADRATIEHALIDKGLRPSVEGEPFWVAAGNNWNSVCHGGLVLAALTVAEREPPLARAVIERARQNIGRVAPAYGPDGAYDEGPMYWGYGTTFLALLCSALESATNTAFDPGVPGLLGSADYMTHAVAPSGKFYNYSDCRPERSLLPALFWCAAKLNRPELSEIDRRQVIAAAGVTPSAAPETDRLLPLALLWHRPEAHATPPSARPLAWYGGGQTPVALVRTAWDDANAAFLGIKGGSPSASHAHMDVGSFVYEADGVRWALDLPLQDYHSLEAAGVDLWTNSQDGERWNVFRVGPDGHGILRFDGRPQACGGFAALKPVATPHAIGGAEVDLTSLYPGVTTRVTRAATLNADGSLDLVDRWQAAASVRVAWQLLTAADVEVTEGGFVLRQQGKRLNVLLRPDAGQVVVATATPVDSLTRSYEAPNPGVSRVVVKLVTPAGADGALHARFVPAPASSNAL